MEGRSEKVPLAPKLLVDEWRRTRKRFAPLTTMMKSRN